MSWGVPCLAPYILFRTHSTSQSSYTQHKSQVQWHLSQLKVSTATIQIAWHAHAITPSRNNSHYLRWIIATSPPPPSARPAPPRYDSPLSHIFTKHNSIHKDQTDKSPSMTTLSPLTVHIWFSSVYTECVKMCSCWQALQVLVAALLVASTVRAAVLETRKSISTTQNWHSLAQGQINFVLYRRRPSKSQSVLSIRQSTVHFFLLQGRVCDITRHSFLSVPSGTAVTRFGTLAIRRVVLEPVRHTWCITLYVFCTQTPVSGV